MPSNGEDADTSHRKLRARAYTTKPRSWGS